MKQITCTVKAKAVQVQLDLGAADFTKILGKCYNTYQPTIDKLLQTPPSTPIVFDLGDGAANKLNDAKKKSNVVKIKSLLAENSDKITGVLDTLNPSNTVASAPICILEPSIDTMQSFNQGEGFFIKTHMISVGNPQPSYATDKGELVKVLKGDVQPIPPEILSTHNNLDITREFFISDISGKIIQPDILLGKLDQLNYKVAQRVQNSIPETEDTTPAPAIPGFIPFPLTAITGSAPLISWYKLALSEGAGSGKWPNDIMVELLLSTTKLTDPELRYDVIEQKDLAGNFGYVYPKWNYEEFAKFGATNTVDDMIHVLKGIPLGKAETSSTLAMKTAIIALFIAETHRNPYSAFINPALLDIIKTPTGIETLNGSLKSYGNQAKTVQVVNLNFFKGGGLDKFVYYHPMARAGSVGDTESYTYGKEGTVVGGLEDAIIGVWQQLCQGNLIPRQSLKSQLNTDKNACQDLIGSLIFHNQLDYASTDFMFMQTLRSHHVNKGASHHKVLQPSTHDGLHTDGHNVLHSAHDDINLIGELN